MVQVKLPHAKGAHHPVEPPEFEAALSAYLEMLRLASNSMAYLKVESNRKLGIAFSSFGFEAQRGHRTKNAEHLCLHGSDGMSQVPRMIASQECGS